MIGPNDESSRADLSFPSSPSSFRHEIPPTDTTMAKQNIQDRCMSHAPFVSPLEPTSFDNEGRRAPVPRVEAQADRLPCFPLRVLADYGRNDPVANKILRDHAVEKGLVPPEDKSIVSSPILFASRPSISQPFRPRRVLLTPLSLRASFSLAPTP